MSATERNEIQSIRLVMRRVAADVPDDKALVQWLEEQALKRSLVWLLAHAEDGVVWGNMRKDGLHLSGNAFPGEQAALRRQTLQQARMFGPRGELLVWRSGEDLAARLLEDGEEEGEHTSQLDGECELLDYYEQQYLLWGTRIEQSGRDEPPRLADGFALLLEGAEGLRHAPPLPGDLGSRSEELFSNQSRLCLVVRHYVAYDKDRQAYVKMSRLVRLSANSKEGRAPHAS